MRRKGEKESDWGWDWAQAEEKKGRIRQGGGGGRFPANGNRRRTSYIALISSDKIGNSRRKKKWGKIPASLEKYDSNSARGAPGPAVTPNVLIEHFRA